MSHGSLSSSLVPFAFVILAAMTGLAAIAVVILACYHRKQPVAATAGDQSSLLDGMEKSVPLPAIAPLDMEPRIVVVMAGDEHPSFLAKPMYSPRSQQAGS